VYVERVLIGQVVLNLAFNAIDALRDCTPTGVDAHARPALPARRELRLVTRLRGRHAITQVIDNGPGVPAGAHGRLFDGFSSSKAGGNGIGLSLCKSIVTRHGGEIWAKPAPHGGLECSFSLPLVSPASAPAG
jgi:two-component system sensor kinase FixL